MHRPAILALVLLHLLAWLGGTGSPAELASAFLPFYLPAYLVLALLAMRPQAIAEKPVAPAEADGSSPPASAARPPRRAPWVALALIGAGIDGALLLPLWTATFAAPAAPLAETLPLEVVFANLKGRTKVREAQLAYLRTLEADVVVLAEVGGPWMEALEFLEAELPYTFVRARDDDFGLALYSRWPLREAEALLLDGEVPTLSVVLETPAGPLRVLGTHAPPPHWRPMRHGRQIEELAEVVAATEIPVLVAGDLNTTPWSPRFRALTRDSGLQRSGTGRGLLASWAPRALPFGLLPIDHVLVRGPFQVRDFRLGPRNGSDHRPVLASLQMGAQAAD